MSTPTPALYSGEIPASEVIARLKEELRIEKEISSHNYNVAKVNSENAALMARAEAAEVLCAELRNAFYYYADHDRSQSAWDKILAALALTPADMGNVIAELREKVAYVEGMGIRFGMMQSSDKPTPYLAHVWDENSDHERMFREWSDSIGWEDTVAAKDAEIARLITALDCATEALESIPVQFTSPYWAYRKQAVEDARAARNATS